MSLPLSHEQLLGRAVAGDRSALELLLLAHYDRLAARIDRALPNSIRSQIGVDDVLQDTFVQAFRDIGGLALSGERAFAAWLDTVADHRLQDALRRARRKKRGGEFRPADPCAPRGSQWMPLVEMLGSDGGTPSQYAAQHEAMLAVQVGMSALPVDQREAIRMHCLDRLSLDETAEAMQRSPGAVRGLVQRGKVALRECLVRSSLWFSRR